MFLIVLFMSATVYATLTYDGTYYRDHISEARTGTATDPIFLAFEEIETDLDAIVAGSADTLDATYNAGSTIDVDGDAVTLTTSDTDDNVVLAIVQNEATNDNDALTVTMGTGAIGNAILIDSVTDGNDIKGDNWVVTQTGALTCVGVTTTGAVTVTTSDVTFDDTYDLQWDTSEDTLVFKDNAVLGFGNTGAAPDVEIKWNASNLLVESKAEDTGEIEVGATNAIDLVLHANTAASEVAFNANTATAEFDGYDLQMKDDDLLMFGDSDEFVVQYDEDDTDNLTIVAGVANDAVQIGDGTTATDFKVMNTQTAGAVVHFDDSDEEWNYGADNYGVDVKFWGDGSGNYIVWDESIDTLVGVDGNIKMDDDAIIYLGTGTNVTTADGDFTINFTDGTPGYLTIAAAANEDVLQIGDGTNATDVLIQNTTTAGADIFWDDSGELWKFGADNTGVDVGFYGDATGDYILWDESIDTLVSCDAQIKMDDDAVLMFGTGTNLTTSDGDFTMNFTDGSPGYLTLTAVAAEDVFQIGDGTIATDVLIQNTTTAGADIFWDDSGELWKFGVDGNGVDVGFYGDTAGDYIIWDESLDTLVCVDGNVKIDDDAIIYIGTKTNVTTADGDFTIQSVSDTRMDIASAAANGQVCIGDGTVASDFLVDNITTAGADFWFDASADSAAGTVYLGIDNKGIDLVLYGETANKLVKWDMSADDLLIGADGEEVDVYFYGAETSDYVHWDGDLNTYGAFVFEDSTIQMQDDTAITFGDARDITMQYDEDGSDNLQVKGAVDLETTYVEFRQAPLCAKKDGAGAPTGTAGDENLLMSGCPACIFEYHIVGTATDVAPELGAYGLDIGLDDSNDDGIEVTEGITARSNSAFTVGTDAFYLEVVIYVTDGTGSDVMMIGFRNDGAYEADPEDYTDMAAVGLNGADWYTWTIDDDGATTKTDVTPTGGDCGDAEAHTVRINVATGRAVTWEVDGAEPTSVPTFSIDDGDVVIPFLYLIHDTDVSEAFQITSWECGLQ
jgi:hypothetical protein